MHKDPVTWRAQWVWRGVLNHLALCVVSSFLVLLINIVVNSIEVVITHKKMTENMIRKLIY